MNEKHYREKLSEFINHELPNDVRQSVGEHLLQCAECRNEHDEIKFGAALASHLKRADAPENLWSEIENTLDKNAHSNISPAPDFSPFKIAAFVLMALLIFCGLTGIIIYKNYVNSQTNIAAETTPEIPNSNVKSLPENSNIWTVETIAGNPQTGNEKISNGKSLTIGETLETDANSRARIDVANIGNVEIAPNSRVKLVNTNTDEHRLSLERGVLQATILAPPRLFIVDTPSAAAVDLGCAYKLEVDNAGNTKLHVTSGFVALERDGRESIVPAGGFCLTKRGRGIGTPYFENASAKFLKALNKFDFENGGRESLQIVMKESRAQDTLTLWNLLLRVPKNEREKILDSIVRFAKLPEGTTREGILNLDKEMLERLRLELQTIWFQ